MPSVRTEGRIEAHMPAVAIILGHPDVQVACQIRDISKSGMCIGVEQTIPIDKIVRVEWSDHFLVGRVQRQTAEEAGFAIGLELLNCSQWKEPLASALAESLVAVFR